MAVVALSIPLVSSCTSPERLEAKIVTEAPVRELTTGCDLEEVSGEDDIEQQYLDLHNEARAAVGVGPLALLASLRDTAQQTAEYLASNNRLEHPSANTGVGISSIGDAIEGWDAAGENVGYTEDCIIDLFQAYMNSPGHRANIVDARMDYVGFGFDVNDKGTLTFTATHLVDLVPES